MNPARNAALRALIQFRRDGAWTDLILKNSLNGMEREDAALATAITYGVMQKMYLLDFYIGCYSSVKLNKIMPQVLDALRCGVYQLLFMDKVPEFAAVNETVALVKKYSNPRAASFANAIMRKICAEKGNLPKIAYKDYNLYMSTNYSFPRWLVDTLCNQFGQNECEKLLCAYNTPAPIYLSVNTLKTNAAKLIDDLFNEGVNAKAVDGIGQALLVYGGKPPHMTDAFKRGDFYIQDLASQTCVNVLNPQPGENIIDMCAAPGGKSILAAQLMNNKGSILSCDIHPHKTELIEQNAIKYGIDIIDTVAVDSTKHIESLSESADRIICDVPCSGFGIIRKKPDIRYKNEENIRDLPGIQFRILQNAARYLKKGGVLVYSTCTILNRENIDVVNKFLNENKDFQLTPFTTPITGQTPGYVTLLPHIHNCDGFFIALLSRK